MCRCLDSVVDLVRQDGRVPREDMDDERVAVPMPGLVLLSASAFMVGVVAVFASIQTGTAGLVVVFALVGVPGVITFRRLKYVYDRPVDGGLRSFSGGPMADIDFLRAAWTAWRTGGA
jgi:uncharacterized membrane-anchored protein